MLDIKCNEKLLDEVFAISRIGSQNRGYQPKAEADNPCWDLDYSGYQ